MRMFVISIIAGCGLWACASDKDPQINPEATIELGEAGPEMLIEPSPAMFQAALAGDEEAMRAAVQAESRSSCHAPNTCPTTFMCPTNWSNAIFCDEFCGGPCGFVNQTIQTWDRFRICWEPDNGDPDTLPQACEEWRTQTVRFCDC